VRIAYNATLQATVKHSPRRMHAVGQSSVGYAYIHNKQPMDYL